MSKKTFNFSFFFNWSDTKWESFLVPKPTPLHAICSALSPCFSCDSRLFAYCNCAWWELFSLLAKQKFSNPYWHGVSGELGSILTCNSALSINEVSYSCKHTHTFRYTKRTAHANTHTHTHPWQLFFGLISTWPFHTIEKGKAFLEGFEAYPCVKT